MALRPADGWRVTSQVTDEWTCVPVSGLTMGNDDGTGKTPTSLSYKLCKSIDPMYNIQDGEKEEKIPFRVHNMNYFYL